MPRSSTSPTTPRPTASTLPESEGILIENVLADHNGWEDGWETGDGIRPRSSTTTSTSSGTTSTSPSATASPCSGSSFGAQIRSGGFIENMALLDNNVALNVKGGNYRNGDYIGNYSLVLDTVTSSGAHKDAPGVGR